MLEYMCGGNPYPLHLNLPCVIHSWYHILWKPCKAKQPTSIPIRMCSTVLLVVYVHFPETLTRPCTPRSKYRNVPLLLTLNDGWVRVYNSIIFSPGNGGTNRKMAHTSLKPTPISLIISFSIFVQEFVQSSMI